MIDMSTYKYKVSYHTELMCTMFIRVKDEAILLTSSDEAYVTAYAAGYCAAKGEKFYIE